MSRTLWQGHATGAIADADAQHLAETIEARRSALEQLTPVGILLAIIDGLVLAAGPVPEGFEIVSAFEE